MRRQYHFFNTLLGASSSVRQKLIRGSIGSSTVKIIHTLLAFLVSLILAPSLGTKGFGIYSFVYTLMMFTVTLAQVGLPQLIIRETANTYANKDWKLMRGLWLWSTFVGLFLSTSMILATLLTFWVLKIQPDNQKTISILIGLGLVPLIILSNLRCAALIGLRHVVLGQLPEYVIRPGLLITFVLLTLAIYPSATLTPSMIMWLYVVATTTAFTIGAILLRKSRPSPISQNLIPNYKTKAWSHAALSLALIAGLQMLLNHTGIIVLGIIRTDDEVGIYRVVAQSGMLVSFVLQAVSMVIAPYVARFFTEGDMRRLQKITSLCTRLVFILSLPIALGLSVMADQFLGVLFGEEYATGNIALIILSVGWLLTISIGPVGLLLQMTGHERDTIIGVGCAALLNVFLNLVLIPHYGVNGAAFSTAITLFISHLILSIFVHTRLGIKSSLLSNRRYTQKQ